MNTSEGALTVIGELRGIIAERDLEIAQYKHENNSLINECNQLRRQLSHLQNSLNSLSEDLMRETKEAK